MTQLLAEYTQGYPVRTFTYDGADRMVEATVFTLTTRFTYNGLGDRVAVQVAGHGTTTYTLDYAAGNRILAEETLTSTTLYLHGRDCLGELRDGDWLYYLPDATGLVRQGVDEQGQVVSGWLFDPDGAVLEGPEGPVSHLVCGGVYDWSTGLIYKGGRYFDPLLGIWLALVPLLVVGRKKQRRGFPWVVVLALCLGGMSGVLTACGPGGMPTPEFLESSCIDVPEVNYKMSVTLQEPTVYKGPLQFMPATWQIRLGNTGTPTLEEGNAGAQILGGVTSREPGKPIMGNVRFEQHVSFVYTYHFGAYGETQSETILFGDINTWYLDGGRSPYGPDGQYTGDMLCKNGGNGICGFMLDAPSANLQQMNATTGAPLVGYERVDRFRTYLLWYPVPSCRIPLASVDWNWKAKAEATYIGGNGYPWKWNLVEGSWETNPQPGEPLEIEEKVTEPYPMAEVIRESPPQPTIITQWQHPDYRQPTSIP